MENILKRNEGMKQKKRNSKKGKGKQENVQKGGKKITAAED